MQNAKHLAAKLFPRIHKRVGLSPGTVEYVGEERLEPARITVMDYDLRGVTEKEVEKIEDCFGYRDSSTVTWINITGVHDTELLKKLGAHFELHPLVLEDMVNTHQRPKIEDYENYIYIVLRMIQHDEEKNEVVSEQVSIVLGTRFVISVQEFEGDVFDVVRSRIRDPKSRLRKFGPDYLTYALVDALVDHYFVVLEHYGEEMEKVEAQLLADPDPEVLQKIHTLKREMVFLRKSVWPLREMVSALGRSESKLIRKDVSVFLRDVHDHTVYVIDAVESFRDIISGMQDLYMSSLSNKMNEVMKVLTIFATIFVPLTFVAGIYGMNFKFMPELDWKWSYPALWVVILGIGGLMLHFFRRKRWL